MRKGFAVTKISNSFAASTVIASLIGFAAPSLAAEPAGSAATVAASAAAPATAASPTAEKRYCVVESLTGSRMPKKVCKTKSEWQQDGMDVSGLK